MPRNNTTKPSSQRKLTFNDSSGQSNVTKQDERHKHAGPPISVTSSKRRDHQSAESYASPQKKRKATDTQNIVTPDNVEMKKVASQSNVTDYIPSYIHKNVEYVRKGQIVKLSSIQSKVLHWIEDNFEIPNDFEQNRKYGPLSGSSYVDRVITAYRLGSLKRIEGSDHDEIKNDGVICTVCADFGHIANTCPALL
jgi:hypothetical protein